MLRAGGGVFFAGYDADNKMAECFRNVLETFKHRYLCVIGTGFMTFLVIGHKLSESEILSRLH